MKLKKPNRYIIDKKLGYGIGITTNTNKEFYFDLEDYDKIKKCSWSENDQQYIVTYSINRRKAIRLHRYILDVYESSTPIIDHKNNLKYDNRKENLRFATQQTNQINRKENHNNLLGVKGVSFDKRNNKYIARISINGKNIYLGQFNNLLEAKKAREEAEIKYFGEFSYKNNL